MVRDLFTGIRAAQLLSRLILVLGVAPIFAPSLGSALLNVTSWGGIFVVLALAAVALWLLAWRALPEALHAGSRQPASPRSSIRAYGRLFSDPMYLGHGRCGRADVRHAVRLRGRGPVPSTGAAASR